MTISLITSCGNNELVNDTQEEKLSGSREFKVKSTMAAFKVSLVGVRMGTPDYEAVWSVIEAANNLGIIDNLARYADLFEGGVAHCIEVVNPTHRDDLTNELINISTSLEESHYLIESVDSCLP